MRRTRPTTVQQQIYLGCRTGLKRSRATFCCVLTSAAAFLMRCVAIADSNSCRGVCGFDAENGARSARSCWCSCKFPMHRSSEQSRRRLCADAASHHTISRGSGQPRTCHEPTSSDAAPPGGNACARRIEQGGRRTSQCAVTARAEPCIARSMRCAISRQRMRSYAERRCNRMQNRLDSTPDRRHIARERFWPSWYASFRPHYIRVRKPAVAQLTISQESAARIPAVRIILRGSSVFEK